MIRTALDTLNGLLDLVYPPKCLTCDAIAADYICALCLRGIEHVHRPYCRRCGQSMRGFRCRNCWGRVASFTHARAVGQYSGVLRKAVHELKYGGKRMLASPLGDLLYTYLEKRCDFPWRRASCVVPVPIHPARERVRGYNQSELVAERLSELTGLPLVGGNLVRASRTKPQVALSPEERRKNVKAVFRVRDSDAVRGRIVLLVDDVATTCSTIHECSLALLKAGAERVYAVCIAFGG